MSVKRYDHSKVGAMYFGENDSGNYVEYSDYAALKEENEALKHDLTRQVEIGSELATENERLRKLEGKIASQRKELAFLNGNLDRLHSDFSQMTGWKRELQSERDTLKARVAELEAIVFSEELKLVLGNYKNSTLVPRHYRICESILKKIEILNSVAVRDSGCSAIRAPLG